MHSTYATQGCHYPAPVPPILLEEELGWHPNIHRCDVPLNVAHQSRVKSDNDSSFPT
jgi:hypothetical protein